MSKYLQMLDELYQQEEKIQIPIKEEVTKPTKALLTLFVSANSKDIQFFSDSELQGIDPTSREGKTVKASKQEVTKPTKDIDDDEQPTNQGIAEHLIGSLKLHDDRTFVRQYLIGIYGTKRLTAMNAYLDQWQLGSDAETDGIKKENAGRYRANVWLRDRNNANT